MDEINGHLIRNDYSNPARLRKTYNRLQFEIPKNSKILIIGDADLVESKFLKTRGYNYITSAEFDFPLPGQVDLDLEKETLDLKFDLIFCSHVLEHLKDPSLMINNIKKMLKIGGHTYIYVPEEKICHIYPQHISCKTKEEWELLFDKFEIIESTQFMNMDQEEYRFILRKP